MRIETYFNSLTCQGPGRRYHPEPSKSVLIVNPKILEDGKDFRNHHSFKVCTDAHYLRGYIGDDESKNYWLRESTLTWEKSIGTISKNSGKYPQESYAAVVHMIQSEWIFIQRVTWDTEDEFAGLEKILWENFLPRPLFVKTKSFSPTIGDLSMILVKKPGLGLLNPVTPAKEKYLSSQRGSA